MQQLCSVPSMRYLVIPKRFLPSLSMLCPSGQRFGQLHGSGPQRQSTIHICANSWSSQKTRYLSTAAVEEYEPITKTVPFLLADIGEGIAEGGSTLVNTGCIKILHRRRKLCCSLC
jgi:hypothetical protein